MVHVIRAVVHNNNHDEVDDDVVLLSLLFGACATDGKRLRMCYAHTCCETRSRGDVCSFSTPSVPEPVVVT